MASEDLCREGQSKSTAAFLILWTCYAGQGDYFSAEGYPVERNVGKA